MALSKEEIGNIRYETKSMVSDLNKTPDKLKKNKKLMVSLVLIFALVAAGISYSFVNANKPSPLDNFAKCLKEKGAVMYGASWCKYTQAQKRMFGNSMKFVDYKDFSENKEVRITPTWFINGNKYENAQSLDKLAAITGCVIR